MLAFLAGLVVGAAAALIVGGLWARARVAKYARLFSFALHELNTPVTAVNMTVINLGSGVFGELPEPLHPWVELAREQMARLNAIVGEFRDFVHWDLHGDLRLSEETLGAAEIAEEALSGVRRSLAQASVPLEADLPPGLPMVRADADRAGRCVTSLLHHARKFRTVGPVSLAVSAGGGFARFRVGYQGPPVPAAEAEACLDLFYPARRGKSQVLAATGMGLGLVREIARMMGGDLDFACDEEGRAAVELRLPTASSGTP